MWQWRTLDNKDSVEAEERDELKGQELAPLIMCYSKTMRRSWVGRVPKPPVPSLHPQRGCSPLLGLGKRIRSCYPARASPIGS